MEPYAWVSSGSIHKFYRAVALLVKEQKPVTEEAVKALYVKWAGKVMEVDPVVEEEEKVEEEKPRRGRSTQPREDAE